MLEIKARPFAIACDVLGQFSVIEATGGPPPGKVTDATAPQIGAMAFPELKKHLEVLAPLSVVALGRLEEAFRDTPPSMSEIKIRVRDLRIGFFDALASETFLHVEAKGRAYYEMPLPVFDGALDNHPESLEDAIEAGKCIALDRHTAAVFHLMRILERFVWAVGDKLGATVKDKDDQFLVWGKILSNIRAKLDGMLKGDEKNKWSEVHALLVSVNHAWRTPTMHPKQTYTETHAKDIFAATSAFVRYLSPLL